VAAQPHPYIYVGIGSNLGDRDGNLSRAISALEMAGFRILAASSIYETEPVDYAQQPWFLNQVVRIGSREKLTGEPSGPAGALDCLLSIEKTLGRERGSRGGPRIIDLDLLLYGSAVIGYPESNGQDPNTLEQSTWKLDGHSDLIVPHPRLHLRRFVLVPLHELAADLVHPVLRKTVDELLREITDTSAVRLYRG